MKKKDLIKAANKGWPDVEKMVDSMLLEMNRAIVNREDISIYNAFKIKTYQTKPRPGYDFKEKKSITVPSSLKVKIVISPKILKLLNERNIIH